MEVLLVDDQPTTVQVFAANVRKTFSGARVHTAVDLPEALQIASARRLDLVLLDLALPSCDGIQAVVRFHDAYPEVPILVLSATDDDARIRECIEAGNWALNPAAPPKGPKSAQDHRRVHMHVFGRSPRAKHPSWRWGEAPRLPDYKDRKAWAAGFEPLEKKECDAVIKRAKDILKKRYA